MNVLIVDDEPELLKVYQSYFQNKGHNVVVAENGAQAWMIFSQAQDTFDVIFTDHRMPELNGIDLIKKIRQNAFTTPIVLISGDQDTSIDNNIHDTIFAHLMKPTRVSELNNIIIKLNATASTPEPVLTPLKKQPKKLRILVVDDEPLLQDLICQVLERNDYHTEYAGDGVEALEKWQQSLEHQATHFDLTIVDLKMPRMDGSRFIQEVRNTGSQIPIIVLTGHADLTDAYALLENYQISDFLSKPLDRTAKLLFSVKNALEKSHLTYTLQTLNKELEQRIEERATQLHIANKKIEQADKQTAILLSTIKHELSPTLDTIIEFTQQQEHYIDEKNIQELQSTQKRILTASKQLLAQIENMTNAIVPKRKP